MSKIPGKENPADLLTKYLPGVKVAASDLITCRQHRQKLHWNPLQVELEGNAHAHQR